MKSMNKNDLFWFPATDRSQLHFMDGLTFSWSLFASAAQTLMYPLIAQIILPIKYILIIEAILEETTATYQYIITFSL